MAEQRNDDESDDRIISIPQKSGRSFWLAWSPLLFTLLGLYWLYQLLTHQPMDFNERLLFAIEVGACFLLALIGLFLRFRLAGKPAFAIRKTGIELAGAKLLWTDIVSVSWSPHEPGTLNVQTASQRYWTNVPVQCRTQVEETLRPFGRWRD